MYGFLLIITYNFHFLFPLPLGEVKCNNDMSCRTMKKNTNTKLVSSIFFLCQTFLINISDLALSDEVQPGSFNFFFLIYFSGINTLRLSTLSY